MKRFIIALLLIFSLSGCIPYNLSDIVDKAADCLISLTNTSASKESLEICFKEGSIVLTDALLVELEDEIANWSNEALSSILRVLAPNARMVENSELGEDLISKIMIEINSMQRE